ncbi:glycoside hydrolase family 10 protein [Capilliphycus salinus ALCB114379]|uniref:glycoside hydrolase family 10 protein n=1 Tax=Capilliphycus salinus TaxID=2768948 RepID=UPI0039A5E653
MIRKRRKRLDWLTLICLSLCLSVAVTWTRFYPAEISQTTVTASEEIRGVWITNVNSGVLFVPGGTQRALDQLSQLNFNTVYPVFWNRGTTFYRSAIARRVTGRFQDILLNFVHLGEDVFSDIISQAHQRDLRVIPWFEYGLMAPINSQLVKRHPEWVTLPQSFRFSATPSLKELENALLPNYPPSNKNAGWFGIKNVWLNPLHPQVQRFIEDLIIEVVIKYDVDGIQFDDNFGMPIELGYDWYTRKVYKEEHGGKLPPNNPADPEWMRWRANKITAFMKTLHDRIKAVKPDCLISLAPNPREFAYNESLQDWQTWVKQGLIEELILQVYRDSPQAFLSELEDPAIREIRGKIPVGIGILSGTMAHAVDIEQIQQQVQVVRDRQFQGVSFFYWETLWSYFTPDAPRERRRVFETLFSPSPS